MKESKKEVSIVSYFNPAELPSSPVYSHAASVDGGRVVYVSGQQSLDPQGQLVGRDDFKRQADQVFANVKHALSAAGASVSDVVAIYTHYVNRADLPAYREARAAFFAGRSTNPPTSTTVQVVGLVAEGALLEVGVTAVVSAG
jgi:enamine deaminase RidA (YjgF/YER057c/UK114 family)